MNDGTGQRSLDYYYKCVHGVCAKGAVCKGGSVCVIYVDFVYNICATCVDSVVYMKYDTRK